MHTDARARFHIKVSKIWLGAIWEDEVDSSIRTSKPGFGRVTRVPVVNTVRWSIWCDAHALQVCNRLRQKPLAWRCAAKHE